MYKNLQNLQGYIFCSLQHLATKLRNFSKRGMLFQAMVIFLPISIFFKILSERERSLTYVNNLCHERTGLILSGEGEGGRYWFSWPLAHLLHPTYTGYNFACTG